MPWSGALLPTAGTVHTRSAHGPRRGNTHPDPCRPLEFLRAWGPGAGRTLAGIRSASRTARRRRTAPPRTGAWKKKKKKPQFGHGRAENMPISTVRLFFFFLFFTVGQATRSGDDGSGVLGSEQRKAGRNDVEVIARVERAILCPTQPEEQHLQRPICGPAAGNGPRHRTASASQHQARMGTT